MPSTDTNATYPILWASATEAATKAMAAVFERDERMDTGACGFAWVEFRPATHPFVKWMKANNLGSKHWSSGWWFSIHHKHASQGMHIAEAGAMAFAQVVRQAIPGFDCHPHSRVD